MFFDSLDQIPQIAASNNFSIFVVSQAGAELSPEKLFKNPLCLTPDEKGKISVDMVREFTSHTTGKQSVAQFLVVYPAEAMNEAAENAFLKNLEEPAENTHYVLITSRPSLLLQTILSRAVIYFLKTADSLSAPVAASDKVKTYAKRMITASTDELIEIATEIAGKKDGARQLAIEVAATGVELLYKSYFATGNVKLLTKLPNFIQLYDNLQANGHIKLHLVADMI